IGEISTLAVDTATSILGTMNVSGGLITGAGTLTIQSGATMNLLGETDTMLTISNVNNAGTTNWADADIESESSTFNNSGTLNIEEDAGDWNAEGGSFENTGTLNSEAEQEPVPGAHVMGIELNSTAAVNVNSGILTLAAGGQLTGTLTIAAASSAVLASGEFLLNAGFAAQGQGIMIQDTQVTVTGTVTAANYHLRAGILGGAGTLSLTSTFLWTGGELRDAGTTRIEASAIMDFAAGVGGGVVLRNQRQRILENNGVIRWFASSGWVLRQGAEITNNGTIFVTGATGETSLVVNLGDAGRLYNHGTIIYEAPSNLVAGVNFRNHGHIEVRTGKSLVFSNAGGFFNTGTFWANENATVQFTGETVYLFVNGTGPAMDGPGWYIATDTVNIEVPEEGNARASNFKLTSNATLRGKGTFSAKLFLWLGGSMTSGGITLVEVFDQLVIDGDVLIDNGRTLRIKGEAIWQNVANEGEGTLELDTDGNIEVNGGSFVIAQETGTLRNREDWACLFVVKNGGILEKSYTELGALHGFRSKFKTSPAAMSDSTAT
ncbi:MAG: hypothetical protein L0Y72_07650, partial [Gemmataceae bacterium]|nr:hypothetical protein [Gemmataceae bacterium]